MTCRLDKCTQNLAPSYGREHRTTLSLLSDPLSDPRHTIQTVFTSVIVIGLPSIRDFPGCPIFAPCSPASRQDPVQEANVLDFHLQQKYLENNSNYYTKLIYTVYLSHFTEHLKNCLARYACSTAFFHQFAIQHSIQLIRLQLLYLTLPSGRSGVSSPALRPYLLSPMHKPTPTPVILLYLWFCCFLTTNQQ